MGDNDAPIVSQPLTAALTEFRTFLEPDDLARSATIEKMDTESLAAMTAAVEPLYGEINQVLDDLVGRPHPLREILEQLETDLNSLAQAAMEAEQELRARQAG